MVFQEQIARVRRVRREFDEIVLNVLKMPENEQFLTDLNQEQLWSGKLSTGEEIVPAYADTTIAYKRRSGQPDDRVTLRDTGRLYRSFRVEFGSNEFTLTADTEYTKYLIAQYGDLIFGLSPDSLDKLRERINPMIVDQVRKILLNE